MKGGAAEQSHRAVKLCVLTPVHWSAFKGGSEYQASLLIDYLPTKYDVEATYLTLAANRAVEKKNHRLVCFSTRDGIRRYGTFFDAWRLYRTLSREAPDVIYQQVGCAHTGIAAFYAKRRKRQMVWRVASDSDVAKSSRDWLRPHLVLERWFLEYGIRNASVVIAQTERQRELLAANFDRSDAIVVRNFHPSPAEPEVAVDKAPSKKIVAWIANIKPLKNPEAFIRLATRFADCPDIEFVMAGARYGKERWLADIASMIERTPNVRHLGELSQTDVNKLLCRAHLLVNTSDYEGFSNTFIQAWMRGVPVVSLNVNPDGLLDGETLGTCSGNERQLYEDVSALLADDDRRRLMGERSRAFASKEFSESNMDEIAALIGLNPRSNGALSTRASA
jgi:glycosyltransferase involved in cell wall biosynthesis